MSRRVDTSVLLPSGITAEQFVEVWQTSPDVPSVCRALGIQERLDATQFAAFLRRRGVPLKSMKRSGHLDIQALTELARRCAPPDDDYTVGGE